ncbi:hypothetical protein C8Q76DRAFT_372329 [Earliella scabrosa]|nr:hypothetical protein C8Q76DRAFT_372329 [Earliella scabrosa]
MPVGQQLTIRHGATYTASWFVYRTSHMGLCFSTPKSKAPSHAYMIDQYPRPVDDRKYEPEQQPPPYSATTPPISGRSEYHGSAAPSDSKASYEPAQSQLGPSASGSSTLSQGEPRERTRDAPEVQHGHPCR